MKKLKLLSVLLLSIPAWNTASALPVTEQIAQQAASGFINAKLGSAFESIVPQKTWSSQEQNPKALFHLFSINKNQGFVLVAADDAATPILAYSTEHSFPLDNMSPEVAYWISNYEQQLNDIVAQNITATEEVAAEWKALLHNTPGLVSRPTSTVTPLLRTTWDQGTHYNDLCPVANNRKTPTGCVATAMAQIMKYWNAPTKGAGTHSYNTRSYGTLSANFGATTYEWSKMPNNLSSLSSPASRTAVATLMYHCGISVEMNYAPAGSGAHVVIDSAYPSALRAFKEKFGYKSTTSGVYRQSYTQDNWIKLLKNEMDAGRPVLYAGFDYSAGAGHAFVFDGYDETNKFHVNWGWSGMFNGYFTVTNLAPSGTGTGGGSGVYNQGQQAIIQIEPILPPQPIDTLALSINNALILSQPEIYEGDSFTVTAHITNDGQLDYQNGIFQAEVFRASDSSSVTKFNRYSSQNLNIGADTVLSFRTNGTSSIKAGNYFITIFYMDNMSTGEWIPLADRDNYVNRIDLKVKAKAPAGIEDAHLIEGIDIYPNPAHEKVIIDLRSFTGVVNTMHLAGINGQEINIIANSGRLINIDTRHLAEGIYIIRLHTDKGISTKKIVVKH